ncbi:hypothetical protein EAE96_007777 [Botrytis aclada]|nr:hypothetical protein EAE96_007777 [Botrytis aclada]
MEISRRKEKGVGFAEIDIDIEEQGSSNSTQTLSQFEIQRRMEIGLVSTAITDPIPLELRRQRRMRVREMMEAERGPWDTERERLDAAADERLRTEATRLETIRSKKENLTRTEVEVLEELKRQDEKKAQSEKRWQEELKKHSTGLVQRVIRTRRRNSIKKTLKAEKDAFVVVKDNLKTQARDAEVEVDREYLKKKEIDYEVKSLWEAEAARWELELEIPSLLRKIELSSDERDYLNTSIANFYVHKRWCMGGPVDREPWYYTPVDRKKVCEDCRADDKWIRRTQERELPAFR